MITVSRRVFAARWRQALLVALLLVGGSLTRSNPAQASIPADPAAHGYIGLCGVDDKPMVGGSIHDKPFVWKAIASQPAPAEARGAGEVATLYAYQPRPNVQASDWSGDTLTATNPYSTPSAPTAQATKLDYTLKDFIDEYPPMVDGLYELRMYFGNRTATAFADSYAATFIKVSGDRWKVVQGGTVNCGKGKAVSTELKAIGTRAAGAPVASAPYGGPKGTGVPKNSRGLPIASPRPSSGRDASGVSASSNAVPSDSAVAPGVVISPSSASGAGGGSSPSGSIWIAIGSVIAAVGIAAAAWFARRVRLRARTTRSAAS